MHIKRLPEFNPRTIFDVKLVNGSQSVGIQCNEDMIADQDFLMTELLLKFHKKVEKVPGFGPGDARFAYPTLVV